MKAYPVPTANHYNTLYKYTGHTLQIFKKYFPTFRNGQDRAAGDSSSVPIKCIHWEE